MTPHAKLYIHESDLTLFDKIRAIITTMPDIDLGEDEEGETIILSCHMLVRAVAKVFSLKYEDGYFCESHDHSWIVTPHNNIVDVYPIAQIGGPTMIDGNNGLIAQLLYEQSSAKKLSRGKFGKQSFVRSVRRIGAALRLELSSL